ncbi:MAG: hypothetical protein ACRDI0_00910 [Actinomycetota bacterium]
MEGGFASTFPWARKRSPGVSEQEQDLPVSRDADPWGTDGEPVVAPASVEHEDTSVRVPRYLWETIGSEMKRFHELSVRLEEARHQMMQVEESGPVALDFHSSLDELESSDEGDGGFRVLADAKFDSGFMARRTMGGEDWSFLRAQVEELREEMNRVIDILVKELEALRGRLEGQELERLRQERAKSWWRRLLEPEAVASD